MASFQSPERNGYLLGGRRVLISDLLDAGLLNPGTTLVFSRPRRGKSYTATVRENGRLELDDGRSFKSPSRAAGVAAGGSIDGWHAWKLQETGEFLDTLRQRLLDESVPADAGAQAADGSFEGPSRHAFLKHARERAMAG